MQRLLTSRTPAMIRGAAARASSSVAVGWAAALGRVQFGFATGWSTWDRPVELRLASGATVGPAAAEEVALPAGGQGLDNKPASRWVLGHVPTQALRSLRAGQTGWYRRGRVCAADRAFHGGAAGPAEPVTHATTILCVRAGGEVRGARAGPGTMLSTAVWTSTLQTQGDNGGDEGSGEGSAALQGRRHGHVSKACPAAASPDCLWAGWAALAGSNHILGQHPAPVSCLCAANPLGLSLCPAGGGHWRRSGHPERLHHQAQCAQGAPPRRRQHRRVCRCAQEGLCHPCGPAQEGGAACHRQPWLVALAGRPGRPHCGPACIRLGDTMAPAVRGKANTG
jgi:hypothetical protein